MSDTKVDRDGVWHVPVTHKDLLKVADSIARDLEACMAERDELRRRIGVWKDTVQQLTRIHGFGCHLQPDDSVPPNCVCIVTPNETLMLDLSSKEPGDD